MGVPKFYRWISERYPCLSETVKEYQIPEFDNLYLDMNGVVHVCSHPEDDNPHFRITEEKIFADIFHYIEVLFRMIKPKKVFFMAIDGVAPRAKMNQQRGRRFRSAREAEDLVRKALEKGEILPKEQRFDSNCITPGTEFMVRLQEQLKYFVVRKVSEDRMWQGVRVFLSGHETPGEGEHKIMDFIRFEKSKPGYDANTRHCLYGLDADLMMLGLSTHEPHFSLLREEVRFGGKQAQKRSTTAEETTFHLLHLSLMREYLDFEFSSLKDKLPFGYDFENILDDWVLMGFLVGNDFIPHLPHLHIHADALPTLWNTYMEVLPTLDGYLNEGGYLNLPRFEKYMKKLSQMDKDRFNDTYADLKWMESKLGGKAINEAAGRQASRSRARNQHKQRRHGGLPTTNEFSVLEDLENEEFLENEKTENEKELVSLETNENADVEEELEEEELTSADEEEEDLFSAEFQMHKNHYYMDKMAYEQVTPEVLRDQAEGYVKAIQWILLYYFNGVPSWSWFYPHHYAPYMSDIKDFSNMKIELDIATPFLPFQQLMAVLPAASKSLLPVPFQKLMTMDTSPVIDFYPVEFQTDLNGKQQDWEAVVLIPFIEEERLLSAMKSVENEMTPEEKARNTHSSCLLYQHTDEEQEVYSSGLPTFPDVIHNHAKLTKMPTDGFHVEPGKLYKGLCEGVRQDVYFPGFPTLKHVKHRAQLRMEGVKVFQMNSRGQNMMLIIEDDSQPDIEQLGQELLGRSLYTSWPHLSEALVVSVANDEMRYSLVEKDRGKGRPRSGSQDRDIQGEKMSQDAVSMWHREVSSLTEWYHDRRGVEVGDTSILLHAKPMVGRKYICGAHGKITLEKQWAQREVPFLYQACVKDITVHDASFKQYKTLDELFPVQSEVFMLGSPNYGCMGEVLNLEGKNEGRIRVAFTVLQEPNFENIIRRQEQLSTQYMPGYVTAQRCGISGHLLSRMTGTIFVNRGARNSQAKATSRFNIGLNLKFNKKNEQVPGWTKKTEDGWMYSTKLISTMGEYIQKFPELFDYVGTHTNEDQYYEEDIFGEQSGQIVQDLINYLKNLPCAGVTPMSANAEILDQLLVKEIEKEVDKVKELNRKKKKHVKMQVRPHLLYRPLDAQGVLVPDPTAVYELFDRVVNVRMGYSVPLGMRGSVIGIHHAEKEQEVIYEVVFDDVFMGGMTIRCSPTRGYRMPPCALVNLSHGERKTQPQGVTPHKPTAVVKPQTPYQQKYQTSYQDTTRTGATYQEPQRPGAYSQLLNKSSPQSRPQQRGNRQQQPFFNTSPQVPAGGVSGTMPSGAISGPMPSGSAQFVTPKMVSRHMDHRSDESRNKNQSARVPEQEPCEFASIWQQLQSASDVTAKPAPSGENRRQPNQPGVPSLQEAAKALQQSPLAARNTTGAPSSDRAQQEPRTLGQKPKIDESVIYKSDSDTGGMQRVDVTALFDQSKQSQASIDSSVVGVMSAQSISQELAGLFQSLETSGDKDSTNASGQKMTQDQQQVLNEQQRKEGTAALCNMLKIGGSQASATAANQASPGKNYGRQVSVQELFEGAQQNTAAHLPAQPQARPQPQGQAHTHPQMPRGRPQPQGQAQSYPPQGAQHPLPQTQQPHGQAQRGGGRQGDLVQSTQVKRGAVVDLQQWCHSVGLKAPRLDYHNVPGRGVSVCITLSNGARYQGSISRTPDQAAESAASMAMINLQQSPVFAGQFVQGRGQGVRPPPPPGGPPTGMFCSSPNSAFTPVRPGQPGDGSLRGPVGGQPMMRPPVPNPQFCHPLGFPNPPVHHGQPHQQAFLHTRQMPHVQRHPMPQPQRYPPQDIRWQHHPPGHNLQGYAGHMGGEAAVRHDGHPTPDTGGNHPRTPRKDNPFVPLQVTVQQKTPNRNKGERSSQSHVNNSSTKPDSSPRPNNEQPAYQKQETPTNRKQGKTKQDNRGGGSGNRGQEKKGPGSGGPPRKGRSRLAANFSGAK